jgi:integrase/recombinase XerD
MTVLHAYEDPARRCLKVHEWPEIDQQLWHQILQPGDILDGTIGTGFHWSQATREKYRKGYGRWLTYLIITHQLDPDEDPTERITPSRISTYMDDLHETISSWTVWGRIAEVLAVVRAFAPDTDWSWLRRVARYLEANGRDERNKLPRLRPSGEIAAWAYERMDAIIADSPDRDPASHYRDALMIALLITCPTMRLGNLTMIEIGKHLKNSGDGFFLRFAADQTKTRKPMMISVPLSVTPYMEHYLDTVRPTLLQTDDWRHLWITKYGKPMKGKTIYGRITSVTEHAFGNSINPHLFRDCAVTTVAIDDPEHIGITAPILGHTDPRTTEKHYIQANAIAAGRRLRKSVDTMRKELTPHRQRRKGAIT